MTATMPLNDTQISSVENCISALMKSGEPLIPELRKRFPGITFVRCNAEDMDNSAYRIGKGYQLFLINCSEACIRLTCDPGLADGLVVAMT
jgi:hypothetical protein